MAVSIASINSMLDAVIGSSSLFLFNPYPPYLDLFSSRPREYDDTPLSRSWHCAITQYLSMQQRRSAFVSLGIKAPSIFTIHRTKGHLCKLIRPSSIPAKSKK